MFVEHAFDVKHFECLGGTAADDASLRDDRGMEAARPPGLTLVPADVSAARASPTRRPLRLPESVYRRRRAAAAMIAAAALALAVVAARPDRVPPGEANPWPSIPKVSIPAERPGVYVVQPGDTLWDVAVAVAPGEDPRGLVRRLADAAGGSTLEPGQQIVIDAVGPLAATGDPERHPDQPAGAAGAAPFAT
jgi:hypothetical protein